MFGAVVVGLGTVGNVRIRHLLTPAPDSSTEMLTIKGFVSRRNLESQQGVRQIPLEEALKRQDIHVAFICTENVSHEDDVRAFLQAGKHVCIEYPMSLSYQAAKDLWDLAQNKGVILHEEHIELMTAEYKTLKKAVTMKNLQEGTLHFTGGALKPGFGFPSFSGISRLTWLVDLFGDLSVTALTMEQPSDGYMKMTAQLVTADDKPLTWIEERGPGLPRDKKISFHFDSGIMTQIPPVPREPVPLFMQDLMLFSRKLEGRVSPEELLRERRRILHCIELAERIQHLCKG
ncbi:biliverdin reductase A [Lampris incognitus]|uniref:biliverdin reductase A n=1 Tax=Lampris incognitus TaxID=2546036 RepID=UPI0024B5B9AC|nr:biliverdin reductase A [Lampris incognitus]